MNVLSLFDGIACGRVALERAGIPVENYFACEIDKFAIKTAQKNYPDIIELGDVFDVDFSALPKIDIVIGGSPCTHWSIAKRDRETTPDGLGGKLFMEYVRALEETKPRWFLYENNFLIHKNIKDFISKKLGVQPIMINSALVSAQNRRRCYWTNIPISEIPEKNLYLRDIVEDKKNKKNIIDKLSTKGESVKKKYGQNKKNLNQKSLTVTAGYSPSRSAGTIIQYSEKEIYALTPLECERLQTLPDNYTEGVSATQRYKQIGNGWTADVIAHILKGAKK